MGEHTTSRRRVKRYALDAIKSIGLTSALRRAYANQLRILCYHNIWLGANGPNDAMFMDAACFRRRLELIAKLGYRVVPLDEAIARLREGCLEPHSVALTIDDGWYGTYAVMLPMLRQMRMPATLYCDTANLMSRTVVPHVMARYLRMRHLGSAPLSGDAATAFRRATDLGLDRGARVEALHAFCKATGIDCSDYVAAKTFCYMTPDDLKHASRSGLDIQLHTHTHSMHDFAPSAVAAEIDTNRTVLADVTGLPPRKFRHLGYPSGIYDNAALPLLRSLKLASATTLCSGLAKQSDDPLLLPRLTDSGAKSEAEFEADLAGVLPWYDAMKGRSLRLISRGQVAGAVARDDNDVARLQ